jgi:ABC-type glycerol-3-phosphate transport system permease component
MAVVLLVTLFFSLSIGMVSSSLSQNDRSAQGAALFLLMLFSVLIPALGHWISRPTVYEAWSYFSPFYAFQTSFDQVYTTKGEHFWNSVLTILGLGVFALLLSSFVVPRTW